MLQPSRYFDAASREDFLKPSDPDDPHTHTHTHTGGSHGVKPHRTPPTRGEKKIHETSPRAKIDGNRPVLFSVPAPSFGALTIATRPCVADIAATECAAKPRHTSAYRGRITVKIASVKAHQRILTRLATAPQQPSHIGGSRGSKLHTGGHYAPAVKNSTKPVRGPKSMEIAQCYFWCQDPPLIY